jgi:hypothetical protein
MHARNGNETSLLGAGLLAMAVYQPTSFLNVTP